ncbi:hypothetical protein TCAL_12554 [Tigriopus californicus]|uniref:Secretoneurin n=1 Tax=Tigriopus californicus TaxID=6832 RepID=A0A553PLT3_TIGCA|nr:hypothetical protein TCAL_12554 [Tigriopus californicus]
MMLVSFSSLPSFELLSLLAVVALCPFQMSSSVVAFPSHLIKPNPNESGVENPNQRPDHEDLMAKSTDILKKAIHDKQQDDYLKKVNHMEVEEVIRNLNALLADKDMFEMEEPESILDLESHVLDRIQQYEDLRRMVQEFSPDLITEDLGSEIYRNGHGNLKRSERVDKEDDWLADPYYTEDFIEPDPHRLFLSSRRRIDPQTNEALKPAVDFEGQLEHPDHIRDQGEQEVIQMTKKDLESLIYQANPALTVKQLSPEPEISFRKFEFDKENRKEVDPNEDSSLETEQTFDGKLRHEKTRNYIHGMKEVPMGRPNDHTPSPLDLQVEEEELKRLAKSIPKKQILQKRRVKRAFKQ